MKYKKDGGAVQPLPGKAKEHDGEQLDNFTAAEDNDDMTCWMIHVDFYSQLIV